MIFGVDQDADLAADGLPAIPDPDPSWRPPVIELVDYEDWVVAQLHKMILGRRVLMSRMFLEKSLRPNVGHPT